MVSELRKAYQQGELDRMTRYGLILAGIFGSYSLGANNIANVVGVFVPVSPFDDILLFDRFISRFKRHYLQATIC